MKVTLAQAKRVIEAVFETGAQKGFKPLAAIVLDAGGHVIAFEKQDAAAPGRFAIAHGKAFGAVMLGMPGSAQMARAEAQPYFMAAVNGVYGGQVIPVPGGVLIMDEGIVIGAVGVTGDTSDNDAEAALEGLKAAGLTGVA